MRLEACLEGFTCDEKLCDDYKCSECKQAGGCARQLKVYRWPRVLVLHMKRFSFGATGQEAKLHTAVQFPINDLNLSAFGTFEENPAPIYDLYAIANHIGGGGGGGHYTAVCKNFDSNKWNEFDDTRVSALDFRPEACARTSYLLFYKRQDV